MADLKVAVEGETVGRGEYSGQRRVAGLPGGLLRRESREAWCRIRELARRGELYDRPITRSRPEGPLSRQCCALVLRHQHSDLYRPQSSDRKYAFAGGLVEAHLVDGGGMIPVWVFKEFYPVARKLRRIRELVVFFRDALVVEATLKGGAGPFLTRNVQHHHIIEGKRVRTRSYRVPGSL